MFERGDIVRIGKFKKENVNAYAKVETVETDRVYICNLNMPFLGTIARWFTPEDIEKFEIRKVEDLEH